MNDLAYLIVESEGNLDEALALAQKAVQADPEEPEMADTLAWIYFQKNQNDSSLQILRGLVSKYPTKSSFRYHLGMALVRAGDKMAAKQQFETALPWSLAWSCARRFKPPWLSSDRPRAPNRLHWQPAPSAVDADADTCSTAP